MVQNLEEKEADFVQKTFFRVWDISERNPDNTTFYWLGPDFLVQILVEGEKDLLPGEKINFMHFLMSVCKRPTEAWIHKTDFCGMVSVLYRGEERVLDNVRLNTNTVIDYVEYMHNHIDDVLSEAQIWRVLWKWKMKILSSCISRGILWETVQEPKVLQYFFKERQDNPEMSHDGDFPYLDGLWSMKHMNGIQMVLRKSEVEKDLWWPKID